MTHCRGTKGDGTPCGTTIGLSPAGLCLNCDPERAEIARASRVAGGKASGEKRRAKAATIPDDVPKKPRNLEDAFEFAAWLTHAVASGRLDARTGHEAAYALQRFQSIAEKRDLEKKIKAMSKAVEAIRKCPTCAKAWQAATGGSA